MKIITAIQPKGGAGKTTLLFSLAKAFHDSGKKVLVLDPDANMSLTNTYERRIDFVEGKNGKELNYPTVQTFQPSVSKLERQISDLGKGYDIVIVDTYGTIERYHNDLLYISNLVLVPTQPNQAAINNALGTCEHIEAVRAENEGMPVYGVAMMNFAKNGVAEKRYRKEFENAYCFEVETRPYGKAYKTADINGLSITELDNTNGMLSKRDELSCENAAIEMRRLCKEIIQLVETL